MSYSNPSQGATTNSRSTCKGTNIIFLFINSYFNSTSACSAGQRYLLTSHVISAGGNVILIFILILLIIIIKAMVCQNLLQKFNFSKSVTLYKTTHDQWRMSILSSKRIYTQLSVLSSKRKYLSISSKFSKPLIKQIFHFSINFVKADEIPSHEVYI